MVSIRAIVARQRYLSYRSHTLVAVSAVAMRSSSMEKAQLLADRGKSSTMGILQSLQVRCLSKETSFEE